MLARKGWMITRVLGCSRAGPDRSGGRGEVARPVLALWLAILATPFAARAQAGAQGQRVAGGELVRASSSGAVLRFAESGAAPTQQALERVTAEDVFRIRDVSDTDMHPDGRRVAFVVSRMEREENTYRRAIWEADLVLGDVRRLTWGDESARSPRWSPDGRWLAFLSSRSGSPQVWLLQIGRAHV